MRTQTFNWISRYGIFFALITAYAISFYHLGARTLHGDELGSLLEAQDLRRNLAALAYFASLQIWMIAGSSVFWLRSLSALFAVGTVAVSYVATRKLWGNKTALIMSALLATAPYVVAYSQEIRFYTLYLFAASLSIWSFLLFLNSSTRIRATAWIVSTFFLMTTHGMAILLVASELVSLYLLKSKTSVRRRIGLISALAIVATLVIVSPLRAMGFNALSTLTHATATYTVSRGLSLAQIAKVPQTVFFFMFGEAVYPLNYAVVVPGFLIFSFALSVGIWRLRQQSHILAFVLVTGFTSLVLLFLVFDALTPPDFQGATARYVIFLVPIFYLVIATAATRFTWLVPLLLVINFAALVSYWSGDWSLMDDLIDWRAVTQWAGGYVTPQTLVLLDGRSQDVAQHYFPNSWNQQSTWNFNSTDASRIVLLSENFHAAERMQTTTLIQKIENDYAVTAVRSQYPLFAYVFDRKTSANDPIVNLPTEIYGLEFADVRLPIQTQLGNQTMEITGAFGLPTISNQMTQTIAITPPTRARRILLLSDVVDASKLATGTRVAAIEITDETGAIQSLPIRIGYETSAWNGNCQPSACQRVYTWRKRFAFLGEERYAESWQEFDASIFSTELNLGQSTHLRSIELKRDVTPGVLYIWGLSLQP